MLDPKPATSAASTVLNEVVAAERLRIVATMIRPTGDWNLAEECLQDAFTRALAT